MASINALKTLCRKAQSTLVNSSSITSSSVTSRSTGSKSIGIRSRHYFSSSSSTTTTTTTASAHAESGPYVSDLQDFFDTMHENGPTTLGTTAAERESLLHRETYLDCGVPESALRFTTTSYGRIDLPPFVHPNEHRVIMTVQAAALPLNALEQQILQEIVGARWNTQKNTLRLSSNQFGSRIENKRHLVSMLNRMVVSCQRLAQEVEKELAAETASA